MYDKDKLSAFPVYGESRRGECNEFSDGLECEDTGMSLRQYAAIKLKVPDSGEEWLDDMIRESRRLDHAGQFIAKTAISAIHIVQDAEKAMRIQ